MEGAGEDGFPEPVGDIVVGSDVWVAAGAWILSGVRIGDGAVDRAPVRWCALTCRRTESSSGNPARLVGYRHSAEQREALLEIAWWNWPEEEVRTAVPLLASKNIDGFISYARERFPSDSHGQSAPKTDLT